MADTKYMMIGMSSSGKTCYLTAMYMRMAVGFDGFTLVTNDSEREKFERDIQDLRDRSIGQDRFPLATPMANVKSYEFTLCYETKRIISFEMLDYAGGALNTAGIDAHEQIKKSIGESRAIYMFIDGALFCSEDKNEREERVRNDCALTLTPIIQDYADAHSGNMPPIVLVITKADLCKKYVNSAEIVRIIRKFFHPAFSEGVCSYICAVSLGDAISDDEYQGLLDPVNVHIPVFIGSYYECYKQCKILQRKLDEGKRELEKIERKIRKGKKEKKWESRKADLCSRLAAIQDILAQKKTLFYQLGTRLEKECGNFECIINGVCQDKFIQLRL